MWDNKQEAGLEFKCSGTQVSESKIQLVKFSNSPAAAPTLPCCKSKIILGCLSAAFGEWSLPHCSALLPGLRAATKANIKCRNLYATPFRGMESFFEKIKCLSICPLQLLICKIGQGGLSFILRYMDFPWKLGPYIPLVKKIFYCIPWIGKNADFPFPLYKAFFFLI